MLIKHLEASLNTLKILFRDFRDERFQNASPIGVDICRIFSLVTSQN